MSFLNFRMRDLIGKTVVWTTRDTPNRTTTKTITKISEVNKHGFRIEGQPSRIFSYRTGHEKLPEGRRRITFGTISLCELIDEDDAKRLIETVKVMGEKKSLMNFILANHKAMLKMSSKDLKTFVTRMKKAMNERVE